MTSRVTFVPARGWKWPGGVIREVDGTFFVCIGRSGEVTKEREGRSWKEDSRPWEQGRGVPWDCDGEPGVGESVSQAKPV